VALFTGCVRLVEIRLCRGERERERERERDEADRPNKRRFNLGDCLPSSYVVWEHADRGFSRPLLATWIPKGATSHSRQQHLSLVP
jgi:hypothetical protein